MIAITLDEAHSKKVLSWIEDKKVRVSNLKPFWKLLRPIVQKLVGHEFSDANPNMWKPLSPWYKAEKVKEGYPATIGVRTGGLKWASGPGAKMDMNATQLTWRVDKEHVNSEGQTVGEYMHDFNTERPQYRYTVRYLKVLIKDTITRWLFK